MKGLLKKIEDFFTDSNGDGDIVRLIGFVMVGCGIYGWFSGRDATQVLIMIGAGAAMLVTGKFTDPTPKA